MILKERNGVRLVQNQRGKVTWFQVNKPETDEHAEDVLHDGTERWEAELAFEEALQLERGAK